MIKCLSEKQNRLQIFSHISFCQIIYIAHCMHLILQIINYIIKIDKDKSEKHYNEKTCLHNVGPKRAISILKLSIATVPE